MQEFGFVMQLAATLHQSIVGSVVECSPATRAARVRFPDDADMSFAERHSGDKTKLV